MSTIRWLWQAKFAQGVAATLLGTVLGFTLAVGWDIWKDSRRESRDRQRASSLVRDEIETSIALLETMRKYLIQDSEAADGRKLILAPLPTLPVEAWQAMRLAGSFSPAQSDLARDIAKSYHRIAILNQMIQARELYKATSQPLDQFHAHRRRMNDNLFQGADELLGGLKAHLKGLGDGGVAR